jgi:hypothetical protein
LTAWHVCQIENNEAVIVGLCGGDADAVAAPASCDVGGVDADVDCVVLGFVEAGAHGGVVVDVVDVAIGWVVVLLYVSVGAGCSDRWTYCEEVEHAGK